MLTALRWFSAGGAICHCKSIIFQKARLECVQTRRKTSANSRKTGANFKKAPLSFSDRPFFNSEHEGFWLAYFDVTNVWRPLCFVDYFKPVSIWLYLKEHFCPRQSGLLVCGVTSDVWTSSEHSEHFFAYRAFFESKTRFLQFECFLWAFPSSINLCSFWIPHL